MFYLYVNKFYFLTPKSIISAIILYPALLLGQVSMNIELLDNWQDNSILTNSSNVRYNECWGFSHNDQEYAIIGSTEGTHFFQITNGDKLNPVAMIPGFYSNAGVIHRDYKTYRNYIYAVCDEGASSLQIFDISTLPDSISLVAENKTAFSKVHNLYIDTANALLYACSITSSTGAIEPMKVFSLLDPINPQLLYTGPGDIPSVHDAFVVDNIAYLNCGYDGLRVYDFTIPANPVYLQNIQIYQDQGYNHQGWLSPDGKTYVFADETEGKRVKKCSVAYNHSITIDQVFGSGYENNSVPHNIMISNEFAYVAYYNEGLRVFDLRFPTPQEIAHYDTYPDDSQFKMFGAWGVYSNLPSGRIIVSDRTYGLFLLEFREDVFINKNSATTAVYPNPLSTSDELTARVDDRDVSSFKVSIFDFYGNLVFSEDYTDVTYAVLPLHLRSGFYSVAIQYTDYLQDQQIEHHKIIVQ